MGDIPALFQPFPVLTSRENYLEWSTNVIILLLFHNNSSEKILDGRYLEPYRKPHVGLTNAAAEVVTPHGQYAGHSPPSAEANILGRELNAYEEKEWEAWARLERMILHGIFALKLWGSREMWEYAKTLYTALLRSSLTREVQGLPLIGRTSTGEEMEERLAFFNKAASEDRSPPSLGNP